MATDDPERRAFAAHVGAKIVAIRKEILVSQVRLSREANIPPAEMSRIERGYYVTSALNVWKIARALGVTLDELMPDA